MGEADPGAAPTWLGRNVLETSPVAEFDFIIVGAGSAGCLLANRLSANPPAHRVLLVEAGGRDNWFWIRVPVGYLYTIANPPRTDWCFMTEPDPGLAGRSIIYARGRVIGGCSSINAMIHMRGQASDYELWAYATGDRRWLWDGPDGQTLATYKELEDYFGGADDWHGAGGEIRVERPRVRWKKILDAWQDAAAELGIEPKEEFNRGDNSGSAYFHVNQKKRGRRWSMADAFLHPISRRPPNLTVYTQTQALKLLLDDQVHDEQRRGAWTTAQHRATGVRLLKDGQIVDVRARKEVILSAGAVGSPHLMQVSGLGPAELLTEHHVPVAVDLPGVGEKNLQDHLQIRSVYRIRGGARTVNTLYRNLITRAGMGIQYALLRSGPMTMPPSTLGGIREKKRPRPGQPPQSGVACATAVTAQVRRTSASLRGHHTLGLQPATHLARPRADRRRGPADPPEDLLQLPVHRRRPRHCRARTADDPADHGGAGAGPLPTEEMLPGPQLVSDDDLQQAARELGTTIFHPVGTCTMGAFDARGLPPRSAATVLDTDCRVFRVAGLRVVDASAMPTITSGNTNAPVMLIAERAARAIQD